MSGYEFYSVEKKGQIAWVYLNRPEKKNAMNPPAWTESPKVFEELDADPEIRAIILAGKGPAFSAGIDLMSMMNFIPEILNPDQKGGVKPKLIKKIMMMQDTMTCIEKCRKPVIAAVHGFCIGAGLDMITACDIRLSTKDAVFSLREAAVGFVADVGVLQRIQNICGQGITRELAFTAKNINGARAKEILLVNETYDSQESLFEAAEKMALEIAANSPLAVEATKDVLNFGIGKTVDDSLKYVASMSANIIPSKDLYEAAAAFAEKRKPVFTGE